MTTIDKLRAEIERLYDGEAPKHDQQCEFEDGYFTGIDTISNFLDTLEEQECPEYCVRSHCIGCSKYNPDKWSNKSRKARVKATGEIVEGFTDGQGHFDVFTDHNICNRYDISAVEFDTLEEPVSEELEEAADEYRRESYRKSIAPNIDGPMPEYGGSIKDSFKAGAEWQKAKMLKDNPVIMSVEDFQALIDSHAKRVEADYKEKMLKEAVRGEVYKFGKVAYVKEHNNAELTKYLSRFNNGDKVKIIVINEADIR